MSSADGFVPSHLPAHRGVTFVRAWAENSPLHRVCLAGELTLARAQLAVAERERRLLRARFERVPAANRPHFAPAERLEILALKSATGWTAAEPAPQAERAPGRAHGALGAGAPPAHRAGDRDSREARGRPALLPRPLQVR